MTLTQAVIARTNDLLKERKMTKRQLTKAANLSEGTLASIYKQLAKSVTLATLHSLCTGFGITMVEFLDCPYFADENLDLGKEESKKQENA